MADIVIGSKGALPGRVIVYLGIQIMKVLVVSTAQPAGTWPEEVRAWSIDWTGKPHRSRRPTDSSTYPLHTFRSGSARYVDKAETLPNTFPEACIDRERHHPMRGCIEAIGMQVPV